MRASCGGLATCCRSWAMQSGMDAAFRAVCASAQASTYTQGVGLDNTNQRQQLGHGWKRLGSSDEVSQDSTVQAT